MRRSPGLRARPFGAFPPRTLFLRHRRAHAAAARAHARARREPGRSSTARRWSLIAECSRGEFAPRRRRRVAGLQASDASSCGACSSMHERTACRCSTAWCAGATARCCASAEAWAPARRATRSGSRADGLDLRLRESERGRARGDASTGDQQEACQAYRRRADPKIGPSDSSDSSPTVNRSTDTDDGGTGERASVGRADRRGRNRNRCAWRRIAKSD